MPLTEVYTAQRTWNAGVERLGQLYGGDPSSVSARGRTAWRTLATKSGKILQAGETICSSRRKALRAGLTAGDQEVLRRICVELVGTLRQSRIFFTVYSQRRQMNAQEGSAWRAIDAELKANRPRLAAALRAVPPL